MKPRNNAAFAGATITLQPHWATFQRAPMGYTSKCLGHVVSNGVVGFW